MVRAYFEGFRELDFPGNDGRPLKGIKLFFSYPSDGVIGRMTDSQFISDSLCQQIGISAASLAPLVFEDVNLETNLKGKIIGISLAANAPDLSSSDNEVS